MTMQPWSIMSLFRAGNDTQQIANSLNRSEAEIYNLIAVERERERLTQAA